MRTSLWDRSVSRLSSQLSVAEGGRAHGLHARVGAAVGVSRQGLVGRAGDGHLGSHLVEQIDDLNEGLVLPQSSTAW